MSLLVLALGFGYLWNRARTFKSAIEESDTPDSGELQQALRATSDVHRAEMSADMPEDEKQRLDTLRIAKEEEVAIFNGATGPGGEIVGIMCEGCYA